MYFLQVEWLYKQQLLSSNQSPYRCLGNPYRALTQQGTYGLIVIEKLQNVVHLLIKYNVLYYLSLE